MGTAWHTMRYTDKVTILYVCRQLLVAICEFKFIAHNTSMLINNFLLPLQPRRKNSGTYVEYINKAKNGN